MSRTVSYIALVVVLSSLGFAQDGRFTTSVDRTQVAVGEQFEITFTLEGSAAAKNFRPPAFTDFQPLSGPNQSTNMQFLNGAMSSSVSYSYVLQPRAEGKFTIGPAAIDYNGKELKTLPIVITVSKGAARPKQQQGTQGSGDEDIAKQIGDNLFLKVVVDKSKAYQGEQITATYKIYTAVNVVNYNFSKVPSLTGFWSEDLEMLKQIQLSNEVVNGRQYRVGVLKKVALFPQRSGTLEIDPLEVDCIVQVRTRRRGNDIFDQFFNDPFMGGASNVNYKVRSTPVKLTVLPLPETVPAGFTGAVGKFTMDAWVDKRQAKTNDAITLKVKIAGRGNLKLLQAPTINVPPDVERYDPKISDNVANQGDRIAGSRTFEYLLIPRHAGEQRIASFPFTYFDPEKKNYVTVKSSDFLLSIEKGSELAAAPSSGISKEDVRLLGEDIRFIRSGSVSFRRKGDVFVGSMTFYALTIAPMLGLVGLIGLARKRERSLGDLAGLRKRKARKIAQGRLAEAKKFLDQKKREEFHGEVSRALWGYVGDKLAMPPAELSIEGVRLQLQSRGISDETLAKLSSTIEACEFARFAPSADSHEMDGMYGRAVELISTMEDHIR